MPAKVRKKKKSLGRRHGNLQNIYSRVCACLYSFFARSALYLSFCSLISCVDEKSKGPPVGGRAGGGQKVAGEGGGERGGGARASKARETERRVERETRQKIRGPKKRIGRDFRGSCTASPFFFTPPASKYFIQRAPAARTR